MQVDAHRIGRAASELSTALAHHDSQPEAVPWLFGRHDAMAQRSAALGSASEWADSAAWRLRGLHGPLGDVRDGVANLSGYLQAARQGGRRTRADRDELVGAVEQAREQVRLLRKVETDLRAPASTLERTLVDRLAAAPRMSSTDRSVLHAIASIRAEEIGPRAPFLAAVQETSERSELRAALLAEQFDVGAAWDALLVAGTNYPVPAESLTRALDLVTDLRGLGARPRPGWLEHMAPGETTQLSAQDVWELTLLGQATDRDHVVRMVVAGMGASRETQRAATIAAAAEHLPADLRVVDPRAVPGLSTMTDLVHAAWKSWPTELVPRVDETYVRLATSSEEILAAEVARIDGLDDPLRQAGLYGVIGRSRPDAILGEALGTRPWARQVFDRIKVTNLHESDARAHLATIRTLRRTGGDQARLIDELDALTRLDPALRTHEAYEPAHALRMLPEGARPEGAARMQRMLDDAFVRSPSTVAGGSQHEAIDRIRVLVASARLAADPATTRAALTAELDALLDIKVAELDAQQVDRLAVLSMLPESLLPGAARHLGSATVAQGRPLAELQRATDRMRLYRTGERLAADPGSTPETIANRLRALVEQPDGTRTVADIRSLLAHALIVGEHDPVRGASMTISGLEQVARIGTSSVDLAAPAALSSEAHAELAQLGLALDRTDRVRSGLDRAQVRRELRDVLGDGTTRLDAGALRRLALLDGVPDDIRAVEHLDGWGPWVARAWTPSLRPDHPDVTRYVALTRAQLDAVEDAAAHSPTREGLTRELSRLLLRDPTTLGAEEQGRIAAIVSMPSDLRPQLLPYRKHGYSIADLAATGTLTGSSGADVTRFARWTVHADAPPSFDDIAALVRTSSGRPDLLRLDPTIRAYVLAAGDDELARLGTTRRVLLRDVLASSAGSGNQARVVDATREALRLTDDLEPVNAIEGSIIERMRTYLHRNVARATGAVHGGYDQHPDYAEHGRVVADAELVGRMDMLRRGHVDGLAASKATAAATPAVETLTW